MLQRMTRDTKPYYIPKADIFLSKKLLEYIGNTVIPMSGREISWLIKCHD